LRFSWDTQIFDEFLRYPTGTKHGILDDFGVSNSWTKPCFREVLVFFWEPLGWGIRRGYLVGSLGRRIPMVFLTNQPTFSLLPWHFSTCHVYLLGSVYGFDWICLSMGDKPFSDPEYDS
jgi:hypothetical protein